MRSALFALLLGCTDPDPCAGKRDLVASPAGLKLTRVEHGIGWGQAECFRCHTVFRIHLETCVEQSQVDVGAIDVQVDEEDPASCAPCHGANGVPGLQPEPVEPDTGSTL